jgi:hypothetical protein
LTEHFCNFRGSFMYTVNLLLSIRMFFQTCILIREMQRKPTKIFDTPFASVYNTLAYCNVE